VSHPCAALIYVMQQPRMCSDALETSSNVRALSPPKLSRPQKRRRRLQLVAAQQAIVKSITADTVIPSEVSGPCSTAHQLDVRMHSIETCFLTYIGFFVANIALRWESHTSNQQILIGTVDLPMKYWQSWRLMSQTYVAKRLNSYLTIETLQPR
jgi:hypothetical protein